MTLEEEISSSEITILPDGRVYVLGMSRPILEILQSLRAGDNRVQELVKHLGDMEKQVIPAPDSADGVTFAEKAP